ncbi:MAG: TPM domain-containing protein [Haliscomenobacter sp.]|nr:TPM domain-containing protein [Haliscomenobacter sp.]MBK8042028.1 TPM domain-containing protein [Haliscomenobacter sp.]MBK8656026.1 TPM domain-containing protein [Haliscomenobacter sp.]MBK8878193.1 TPM domain-containing protein [Haliscomenobacter sp.]MBP9077856.1 TPM domain-containing protein [Haliscomenobacter sp.]
MPHFISKQQEEAIIHAIRDAESQTSGEVRVHIQKKLAGPVLQEAQKVFFKLNMHQTRQRNGVLFFISPENRQFAVLGDQGINEVVPSHFWEDIRDLLREHFRQGLVSEGISAAVRMVGEKLHAYFPVQTENPNELSDDISFGEED